MHEFIYGYDFNYFYFTKEKKHIQKKKRMLAQFANSVVFKTSTEVSWIRDSCTSALAMTYVVMDTFSEGNRRGRGRE